MSLNPIQFGEHRTKHLIVGQVLASRVSHGVPRPAMP